MTLTGLAVVGLIGLGVLWWQRQRPPLMIEEAPPAAQAAQWDAALARARAVDVNAADAAELERLPGIGPVLAGRIVAYRRAHGDFATPEALAQIPGISRKTYESLRDYVMVQPGTAKPVVSEERSGEEHDG